MTAQKMMNKIRSGIIKRIHVNRKVLARNVKTGQREAPLTIQTTKGPIRAMRVKIRGGEMVYGKKPLSCGARVWLETRNVVEYY
jgi:hypothetical protein